MHQGLLQSPSVGLEDFDLAVSAEIFTKGVGVTPVCASNIAAFYSATALSVRWFSGLSSA